MPPSMSMTNSGSAIALVALAGPGSTLAGIAGSTKPPGEPARLAAAAAQQPGVGGTSALVVPALAEAPAVAPSGLARVKLSDLLPEDGAAPGNFFKTVESLSLSLARYNAAVIQLSAEDQALVKCAIDSSRLYFKSRAGGPAGSADWTKSGGYYSASAKDMYFYRAGRLLASEEHEWTPPCMSDVFRCFGKASRAALAAISRHLRLRSDALGTLLDDYPLPAGEVSSSVLTATCHHSKAPAPHRSGAEDRPMNSEVEKGLLMLSASDMPGLQVCDASGKWFLADHGVGPGELVLLTGRALYQATAGLRLPGTYRILPPAPADLQPGSFGRCSLTFRLMPRPQAIIDCTAMQTAGHSIPEAFQAPVPVPIFMETLANNDTSSGNSYSEVALASLAKADGSPSLRSVLTDPASGSLLEDAMVSQCGHSFGGASLRRILETMVCPWCGGGVDVMALVPNLGLRAAVAAYKREEVAARQQSALRGAKRKREREAAGADGRESGGSRAKKTNKALVSSSAALEYPASATDSDGSQKIKGVQFPYSVNDYVLIKGNKRTPEKFVGREAVITNQCLNGWYLVRTLDTGESVRLQYRSLQRTLAHRLSGPKGVLDGDAGPLSGQVDQQDDCAQADDLPLFPQAAMDAAGAFALAPLGLPAPYSPHRGGESPSGGSVFPTTLSPRGEGSTAREAVSLVTKDWKLRPMQEGSTSGTYGTALLQVLEPGEFTPDSGSAAPSDMKNAALQATPSLQPLLQPVTRPRSPGRIGKNMAIIPFPAKGSFSGKASGNGDGSEGVILDQGVSAGQRSGHGPSVFKVRSPVGKSTLGSTSCAKPVGVAEKLVKKEPRENWPAPGKEAAQVPGSSQSSGSASGAGSALSGGAYTNSVKVKDFHGDAEAGCNLASGVGGGSGSWAAGGGSVGTQKNSREVEDSLSLMGEEEDGKKSGAINTLSCVGAGGADLKFPPALHGTNAQPMQTSEMQQQVVVPPKKRDLGSLTGKVHGNSSPRTASAGYLSPSHPAASGSPQRAPMSPPPDRAAPAGGALVDESASLQQSQRELPADLFQGEGLPSTPGERQSGFLDDPRSEQWA